MAIVICPETGSRKRIPGVTFHKRKGQNEWWMLWCSKDFYQGWAIISPVVSLDTKGDPRNERFYYCSPVSQPVFLDATEGLPNRSILTDTAWAKIPEGWRAAFRDYLRDCGVWPW